jgi:hypothetical protein
MTPCYSQRHALFAQGKGLPSMQPRVEGLFWFCGVETALVEFEVDAELEHKRPGAYLSGSSLKLPWSVGASAQGVRADRLWLNRAIDIPARRGGRAARIKWLNVILFHKALPGEINVGTSLGCRAVKLEEKSQGGTVHWYSRFRRSEESEAPGGKGRPPAARFARVPVASPAPQRDPRDCVSASSL